LDIIEFNAHDSIIYVIAITSISSGLSRGKAATWIQDRAGAELGKYWPYCSLTDPTQTTDFLPEWPVNRDRLLGVPLVSELQFDS
jgi:hypothetical protein